MFFRYTMTGDESIMNDSYAHEAGVIPRVLFKLFNAIDLKGGDYSVTCSFLELYNEELRDLLDDDESKKLRIFDDTGKKAVTIQGLTDAHLVSPISGMQLLQRALEKRHVAATKINDLSSRSHTVFTINVALDADKSGEYLTRGKINLVDLAGSENIGKSGAENKRAREAGMINQSLLTLGRVINSLVDKSPHVPYRESKLTRLLQDSLGGRTKTCIIATVSPALVNVEETLSTLEYASRAKNIKNKPQMNSTMPKKAMLKEYASDMEKLRQDLIATRKKNGIYLDSENYKEIMAETESQKILVNEQQRKLDTVNRQLKAARELVESTKQQLLQVNRELESSSNGLNDTMSELKTTSSELQNTRDDLQNGTGLRLSIVGSNLDGLSMGQELISTLDRTITDVNVLHDRLQKKYQLDNVAKESIVSSCVDIGSSVSQVQNLLNSFSGKHNELAASLSDIINQRVQQEVERMTAASNFVDKSLSSLDKLKAQIQQATGKSEKELNDLFSTVDTVRQDIKSEVRDGLKGLQQSASDICVSIGDEIFTFKSHIQTPISDISQLIQTICDESNKQTQQSNEAITTLQNEMATESNELQTRYEQQVATFNNAIKEQQANAEKERKILLTQMTDLINSYSSTQQTNLLQTVQGNFKMPMDEFNQDIHQTTASRNNDLSRILTMNNDNNDHLKQRHQQIATELDTLMNNVEESGKKIQSASNEINTVTKQSINQQVESIETNIKSLDDFVSKVNTKSQDYGTVVSQNLDQLSTAYHHVLNSMSDQLQTVQDNFKTWSTSGQLSQHTGDLSSLWENVEKETQLQLSQVSESLQRLRSVELTAATILDSKKKVQSPPSDVGSDTQRQESADDGNRIPLNEISQAENQLPSKDRIEPVKQPIGDEIVELPTKRTREDSTSTQSSRVPRHITKRRVLRERT